MIYSVSRREQKQFTGGKFHTTVNSNSVTKAETAKSPE